MHRDTRYVDTLAMAYKYIRHGFIVFSKYQIIIYIFYSLIFDVNMTCKSNVRVLCIVSNNNTTIINR